MVVSRNAQMRYFSFFPPLILCITINKRATCLCVCVRDCMFEEEHPVHADSSEQRALLCAWFYGFALTACRDAML